MIRITSKMNVARMALSLLVASLASLAGGSALAGESAEISYGIKNYDVRIRVAVQRKLKELGYYSGDVDGLFGPKSLQALHNFRLKNNLGIGWGLMLSEADIAALFSVSSPTIRGWQDQRALVEKLNLAEQ